jgi:hypothetical protein
MNPFLNLPLKKSYAARAARQFFLNESIVDTHTPQAGDVACFEVLELGKHSQLQLEDQLNHHILPGDRILVAFGNRYATNQFEGYVPTERLEEYHLLAQGGVAGILKSSHAKFQDVGPTTLRLLSYAVDEYGQVINTIRQHRQYTQNQSLDFPKDFKLVLSVGTSMDSGKTTSAAHLCRGLALAGQRPVFIKLTGTAFTKDAQLNKDLGAVAALDFTEFGYPSTYLASEQELVSLAALLMKKALVYQPSVIVMEIADGVVQRETEMLLRNTTFRSWVDHIMLSAGDSLGLLGAMHILKDMRLNPVAVTGLFTASPLLIEEAQNFVSQPVFTLADLRDPSLVGPLFAASPAGAHMTETAQPRRSVSVAA